MCLKNINSFNYIKNINSFNYILTILLKSLKLIFMLFNKEIEERYILSLDGGGIRGLIPAMVLDECDKILKANNADHSLYAYFDLIIGTSTGGIISLSLANENTILGVEEGDEKPSYTTSYTKYLKREVKTFKQNVKKGINISKIKDLYFKDGGKIFSPQNTRYSFLDVLTNKYSAARLYEYFVSIYAEEKLSSLLVPTAVVSSDLVSGHEVILSSYNEYKDYKITDAARATSAAPTYFDVFPLDDKCLADGALIANNPALVAYIEARKLYPNCKKFHILSISTGSGLYTLNNGPDLKGPALWAKHIHNIFQSNQQRLVDVALDAITDAEYTRIDAINLNEKLKMDDIRPESLQTMKETALDMINANHQELEDFIAKAINRKLYDHLRQS